MKKIYGIMICIFFVTLSCATTEQPAAEPDVTIPSSFVEEVAPNPVNENEEETPIDTTEEPVEEEAFDPSSITQEVFEEAKSDVQIFIEELNQIIRNRDYQAWITHLGPNYLEAISDPGFLARISESARLATQKIVLERPEDYFLYVVVPSRANDRVDDIEFIGKNQVKAFTVTPRGQRLRLYNLEKNDDNWKIIE
ncbi:MAG: hypothetical protein LBV20_06195 [Treponema sp.]|jgi:hypothetical protein|nr:hypothetical protein [Treponema sp.]